MYFTGRGAMTVETNSPKATARMHDNQGKLDLIGDRLTERRARLMTRSVWKSTLELLIGTWAAMPSTPRWTGPVPLCSTFSPHGWAVVPKHGATGETVNLEYLHNVIDGRDARLATMSVFGVVCVTDAPRPDLLDERMPPDTMNLWRF